MVITNFFFLFQRFNRDDSSDFFLNLRFRIWKKYQRQAGTTEKNRKN